MLKHTTDFHHGACEVVQGLSDLFNIRLQNDDVQNVDTRWDQALLAASEMPAGVVLDCLHKSKLQDSVELQTVLVLYEQENIRNNEQPSHSRLKTTVRRHIDQTMRTRNFRARNEVVERGAVIKSQKGRKANVERNVGKTISGKQLDSVRKETHVGSVMETDTIRDKKDSRPLLHQKCRHRLAEKFPQKVQAADETAFLEREEGFRVEFPWEKVCVSVM